MLFYGSRTLLLVREFKSEALQEAPGLYLPWNGELCEARREQTHEYHLEAGQPHSGKIFEEDKLVVG